MRATIARMNQLEYALMCAKLLISDLSLGAANTY